MKLFISRGNFDRLCAGLSPIARAELAEQVVLYPDGDAPQFTVDQERIGAAWAKLIRDLVLPARLALPFLEPKLSPWPTIIDETHVWPVPDVIVGELASGATWAAETGTPSGAYVLEPEPGDGHQPVNLPPPWDEAGPGLWIAPAGTPPPWAPAEEITNDWAADVDANPVDDIRGFRAWREQAYAVREAARPRRLEAGYLALYALTMLVGPKGENWAPPGALAAMAGVPIVGKTELPANAWRLVDPVGDTTILEGTIGATIEELKAVIEQAVTDLAEESGVPRHLLAPDYPPA
jgi:hypothetical protein